MVSSALDGGGVPDTGVTVCERSGTELAEATGVILIRFQSDCGSSCGEGADEPGALPGFDDGSVWWKREEEVDGAGEAGRLDADSAAPSFCAGGVGLPNFARRLLRIWTRVRQEAGGKRRWPSRTRRMHSPCPLQTGSLTS